MIARIVFRTCAALLIVVTTTCCVTTPKVFHVGEQLSVVQEIPPREAPSHFICWNVHKASDDRFVSEVRGLLESIPKDDGVILCLQEVRSSTYDLIKNLHREDVSGHYAPSWRRLLSGQSTGVLTVGNHPLPASGAERIASPGRELFVVSPKVSLRTEVPLGDGRTMEVINCHGLNFVREPVFVEQLDLIFGALGDRSQPAIVCGDFNAWSARRLALLREKAGEAGLREAKSRTPVSSPAPKWASGLEGFRGYDPDIALDRIFTRGLDVLDCYSVGDASSSDHKPLVLRFAPKGR